MRRNGHRCVSMKITDPIPPREAAKILGCHHSTVKRLGERRILHFNIWNGTHQFSKKEVERLKSVGEYVPWKRV